MRAVAGAGRGGQPSSLPKPLNVPVIIDFFSGEGNFGRECSAAGFYVLLWDIRLGPKYDLVSRHNRSMIIGWVTAALVQGWGAGIPCGTFSRARDAPPGPFPLRSDAEPMGKSDLHTWASHIDMDKVRVANILLVFICGLAHVSRVNGIPWYIENPRTSRLWLTSHVRALKRNSKISSIITDYCMWGKSWRKSTQFMFFKVDLSSCVRRCLGAPRGLCARTLKKHFRLEGHVVGREKYDRAWNTAYGNAYPISLCKAIANAFYDVHVQTRARNFAKHI